MAGQVGVNRFSGSYMLDDAEIEIGMLVSTLMAGPPELMALEQRFGMHLPGVHAVRVDDDHLILGEGDRSIRLGRAPGSPPMSSPTRRDHRSPSR